MSTTAKLSYADHKAREAKNAMRRTARRLQVWSKQGYSQTLVQGPGDPQGVCWQGQWDGWNARTDGLTNLRRLIGQPLSLQSRRIIVNAARALRNSK